MNTDDMTLTMIEMQDKINQKIHPEWRDQSYPWYRAIWVECAELMGHLGYKWWKKQEVNIAQAKLELVDIWHFGLSDMMNHKANSVICADVKDAINRSGLDGIAVFDFYREECEDFTAMAVWDKTFYLDGFFYVVDSIGMTYEELYRLYVAKNVLNEFRQNHGYNTGGYVKTWGGKEDNQVLMELVGDSLPVPDDLYHSLVWQYARVVGFE